MRFKFIVPILAGCFVLAACNKKQDEVLDYIDPFISTEGDHGHWHPSANVPFGMVKLCPDTYPSSLTGDGDWAHSGYNYADSLIRGFSHFRVGSSGGGHIYDRAGLLSIMPFQSSANFSWIEYPKAEIDKTTENASPGYYTVFLNREQIKAELTATSHAGYHRYTFKSGDEAKLFLYSGKSGLDRQISFRLVDKHHIEGYFNWKNPIYFIIEFKQAIKNIGIPHKDAIHTIAFCDTTITNGFACIFEEQEKPIEVKVAVSFTSLEGAKNNLETTCPHWDFEKTLSQAENLWRDRLSAIQVRGKDDRDKRIFYTSLYRTCFLPIMQSDVDGTYKGFDEQLHEAKGGIHYNGFAFWDSFRSKYPLYSLFCPDVYSAIANSIYDTYEQAEDWAPFPDSDHKPHNSPLFRARGKNDFAMYGTVRHEHMLMVMVDAYYKGLYSSHLSIEDVFPHIKNEALMQMPVKYDAYGYIPERPDQTGEYCWDNWCVAKVAKDLNKPEEYAYFSKRAAYWKNTWDTSINFFRARGVDGTWLDFPEDPTQNREKYTYEGSKWHWRWNALHNVDEMVEELGGQVAFLDTLNHFFENDLYTAGNQIDLHVPFLFNPAGAPWLTQKWVNQLLKKPTTQLYGTHGFFKEPIHDYIYKDTPDGFLEEMDGDFGCMSAWYNLAAIGLYQICPGNTRFEISTPIFEYISIDPGEKWVKNKKFEIVSRNFSPENIYIQSAMLNGVKLNRAWIDYSDIAIGGKLELILGVSPNKDWGTISNEQQAVKN